METGGPHGVKVSAEANRRSLFTKPNLTGVRLDWKAYFRVFCERHGEPVQYRGRLLFCDGWMYSDTDYKGPEWPPPEDSDKRLELHFAYWLTRRRDVVGLLRLRRDELSDLREQSHARGAPLQCVAGYYDGEGKYVQDVGEVDFAAMESTVSALEAELEVCDGELKHGSYAAQR